MALLLNSTAFVQLVCLRPSLGVLYKFRRSSWHRLYILGEALSLNLTLGKIQDICHRNRRRPPSPCIRTHARTHPRPLSPCIHAYTHARCLSASTHARRQTFCALYKSANVGSCNHMVPSHGENNIQNGKIYVI